MEKGSHSIEEASTWNSRESLKGKGFPSTVEASTGASEGVTQGERLALDYGSKHADSEESRKGKGLPSS